MRRKPNSFAASSSLPAQADLPRRRIDVEGADAQPAATRTVLGAAQERRHLRAQLG
jgi:hypothetical protein